MEWLKNQPLFVILLGTYSFLMYVPVFFSARLEQWWFARTFFYHGTFFLVLTILIAIAFSSQPLNQKIVSRIFDLFCSFVFLPIFLAIPVDYLVPSINLFDAYFEMLSCFTTTGASLFSANDRLPDVLHLWRAIVGWSGGLLMLIAALGIFQPAGLAGFEVYTRSVDTSAMETRIKRADIRSRMITYSISIIPVYLSLTIIMSIMLIISGDRPLVAVIHAMSTFSTSGISNVYGIQGANSGIIGEIIIALFLIFAISRFMYQQDAEGRGFRLLKRDKEVNLMLICQTLIPLLLFMRHWSQLLNYQKI